MREESNIKKLFLPKIWDIGISGLGLIDLDLNNLKFKLNQFKYIQMCVQQLQTQIDELICIQICPQHLQTEIYACINDQIYKVLMNKK